MYTSASPGWRRRGLKRVQRSNLDQLILRAFSPTCAGTILDNICWSQSIDMSVAKQFYLC